MNNCTNIFKKLVLFMDVPIGTKGSSLMKKNRRWKISWHYPFKRVNYIGTMIKWTGLKTKDGHIAGRKIVKFRWGEGRKLFSEQQIDPFGGTGSLTWDDRRDTPADTSWTWRWSRGTWWQSLSSSWGHLVRSRGSLSSTWGGIYICFIHSWALTD